MTSLILNKELQYISSKKTLKITNKYMRRLSLVTGEVYTEIPIHMYKDTYYIKTKQEFKKKQKEKQVWQKMWNVPQSPETLLH